MLVADTLEDPDDSYLRANRHQRGGRSIITKFDYPVPDSWVLANDAPAYLRGDTAVNSLTLALGAKHHSDTNLAAVRHFDRYRKAIGLTGELNPSVDPLEQSGRYGRLFDFANWLRIEAGPLSAKVIDGYVSTVRSFLSKRGIEYKRHELVGTMVKRLRQQQQVSETRVSHHRDPTPCQMVAAIYQDKKVPLGVRTAIVIGFNGLLRPGTYCVPSQWKKRRDRTLTWKDVRLFQGQTISGYTVRLKRERADHFDLDNIQHFARDPDNPLCPAKALDRYMRVYRDYVTPDTPFFIKSEPGEPLQFVSSSDVSKQLKIRAVQFHMNPRYQSGQALRIGGASHMADGGASWSEIQQRGRWSGRTFNDIVVMYERLSEKRLMEAAVSLRYRESFPLSTH